MNLEASSLVVSLFVGLIGMGLFGYGKKQERLPQLVVGVAMMVFPWVVSATVPMLAISAALLLGLFVATRLGW